MNSYAWESRVLSIPDQARQLMIQNDQDFIRAGECLVVIKTLRKEISDTFDPIIKKAHDAHKEALGQKKKSEEPLLLAENELKPKIADYESQIEIRRCKEEDRLAAEMQKQEEERRLEEAFYLEATGQSEKALEVLDEVVLPPPIQLPQVRLENVSMRQNWQYQVIDFKALPDEYKMVDTSKLGGVVRAMKGNVRIPGVKVFPVKSVIAKSA